jgi:hypothetical protein
MKQTIRITLAAIVAIAIGARAQDAAQPAVDLHTQKNEAPPVVAPSPPPDVPELSQLDEAFKQTSLGKAADEYRLRIEWKKLQNQITNDPDVVAAKAAVETTKTDLEKRERLRDYYNIYYGRMRARASSAELKAALDKFKADKIASTHQPRVRPEPGVSATVAPKPTPHKKRKSFLSGH